VAAVVAVRRLPFSGGEVAAGDDNHGEPEGLEHAAGAPDGDLGDVDQLGDGLVRGGQVTAGAVVSVVGVLAGDAEHQAAAHPRVLER
jgi:hypothetical protein